MSGVIPFLPFYPEGIALHSEGLTRSVRVNPGEAARKTLNPERVSYLTEPASGFERFQRPFPGNTRFAVLPFVPISLYSCGISRIRLCNEIPSGYGTAWYERCSLFKDKIRLRIWIKTPCTQRPTRFKSLEPSPRLPSLITS